MSSSAEKAQVGTPTTAPINTPTTPSRRPSPANLLRGSLVRGAEEHREGNEEIGTSELESKIAKSIPVELVDPCPWQPRKIFNEKKLQELADQIDAMGGLQQPIEVRAIGNRYQLVSGERRLRAHKILKKLFIQAFVVNITDEEASARALAENQGRENLTDFEVYLSIKRHQEEFGEHHGYERWGMGKSSFYRLMAFDSFTPAINELLTYNPELVNAYAADEVKRLVGNEVAKGADKAKYDTALKTLVQQAIGSGKRLTNLAAKLFTAINPNKTLPNKKELKLGGAKAAEITKKANFTQLKLQHSAFPEEALDEIFSAIQGVLNKLESQKELDKEAANA